MNKEEFEKLPPMCKRMAIAEDVIAQIRAQRLLPIQGEYVVPGRYSSSKKWDPEKIKWHDPRVYNSVADSYVLEESCHVCAIGAAFVSAARCGAIDVEGWTTKDFQGRLNLVEALGGADIFDDQTLCAMEDAFEKIDWNGRPLSREDTAIRLERIMQYILDHNGQFDKHNFWDGQ